MYAVEHGQPSADKVRLGQSGSRWARSSSTSSSTSCRRSPSPAHREHGDPSTPPAVALAIVLKRRYGPDLSNVSRRSVE
jgi:hypothetical protein